MKILKISYSESKLVMQPSTIGAMICIIRYNDILVRCNLLNLFNLKRKTGVTARDISFGTNLFRMKNLKISPLLEKFHKHS